MRLRNHLIAHLEEADSECCQVKNPLLTFVVAGGGFAGVETIAGINDFVRGALRSYPNLREDMIRVVLVHPGKFILPELGEKLGAYTQRKLEERKVEIRVNTKVAAVTDRSITLSDGTEIFTNTLVWTAGTSPNPLLAGMPCVKERGRLVVNEFLEVCDWPNVWALGDCAAIPIGKAGRISSSDGATRAASGKDAGKEYFGCDSWRKKEAIYVFHDRATRCDWQANWGGEYLRRQFLGIHRLVDVAHDLSEQAASIRKKGSSGTRLDARSSFFQGSRSVSRDQSEHRHETG